VLPIGLLSDDRAVFTSSARTHCLLPMCRESYSRRVYRPRFDQQLSEDLSDVF
jgi:hypothetical protein